MDDRALVHYFTSVADASAIPILLYNVPKFTHLNISVRAVEELSQHPNIIGMKDSSGDVDHLKMFKDVVPEDFNLIVGSGSAWYAGIALGIRTAILAVANCLPEPCAEIQRLYENKKYAEAQSLQSRLKPVNIAVTETFGVAGLKYACTLMGYEGGFPRSPLLPLKKEQEEEVRQALIHAGFLE